MPTLDPQVAAMVAAGRNAGARPYQSMTPQEARVAYAASWDVLQLPAQEVAAVRDIRIPGPGGDLMLRTYRGIGTKSDELLPCQLFLHGGGWVIGNLDSHDRLCRAIANIAGICVVAVDYRLAPEHRYPAALEDSIAAMQWVVARADELRIAPERLAVGGDSAGGGLAAVLALMARDGHLPPLIHQSLIYPVLDLRANSASYQRVEGVPLTAETMEWFIGHYLSDPAQRMDWRASPALATSLANLPPTSMVTVANDPLCDEGRAYARRLEAEGVRVASLHLSDHMHGMLMHGKLVRASRMVLEFVGASIRDALNRGDQPGA